MTEQVQKFEDAKCVSFVLRQDSDGSIVEIILNHNGFHESFAVPTTDFKNSYWELVLQRQDGQNFYFVLPYTTSKDILETLFLKCIHWTKGQ